MLARQHMQHRPPHGGIRPVSLRSPHPYCRPQPVADERCALGASRARAIVPGLGGRSRNGVETSHFLLQSPDIVYISVYIESTVLKNNSLKSGGCLV